MRLWLVFTATLWLTGCPRDTVEPEPPPGATRCVDERDCNEPRDGGGLCGPIVACVAGICEQAPSRVVPCVPR